MVKTNENSSSAVDAVGYYEKNADQLFSRYESISSSEVHKSVLDLIPVSGAALDIGAGSGRDAAELARRGLQVTAVEPAEALLARARRTHRDLDILWICDQLPDLSKLVSDSAYDFVLLAAVWMHVPRVKEAAAVLRLAEITKSNGIVVVSLRNPAPDIEGTVEKETEQVIARFEEGGFTLIRNSRSRDVFGRKDIEWTEVAFRMHR